MIENQRFADVKERLLALFELVSHLGSFKIQPVVLKLVVRAAELALYFQEGVATSKALEAERVLNNNIRGYFRNSPDHFSRELEDLKLKFGLDSNLLEPFAKLIVEERAAIAANPIPDIPDCVRRYNALEAAMTAAKVERDKIVCQRVEKRRVEERDRKDAKDTKIQRRRERKQRELLTGPANLLLAAVSKYQGSETV